MGRRFAVAYVVSPAIAFMNQVFPMVDLCIYLNTLQNAQDEEERLEKGHPPHGILLSRETGPLHRPI